MGRQPGAADDERFMKRALALAARGLYTTPPNPRVGSVVVRDGAVLGEGFHRRAGEPHAEANALADARARGHDPRGATVYSTLEPCNAEGRMPPCARALVEAGVARVIYGLADPNPAKGGGRASLEAAGIEVRGGVGEDASRELNLGFVSLMTRGLPWVRCKVAASLDGRTALASGESQWITGAAARADGHAFRARAGAVLTGIGTVLRDDPQLTVRAVETPRQPLRVVVDRHGELTRRARVLGDGNALVVTAGRRRPDVGDVEVVELPDGEGRVDLHAMMRELGRRGVNEVHVEAGGRLNGALMAAGLIDEWLVYLAPALLGDPARGIAELASPLASLSQRTALAFHSVERIGDDLRVIARRKAP